MVVAKQKHHKTNLKMSDAFIELTENLDDIREMVVNRLIQLAQQEILESLGTSMEEVIKQDIIFKLEKLLSIVSSDYHDSRFVKQCIRYATKHGNLTKSNMILCNKLYRYHKNKRSKQ